MAEKKRSINLTSKTSRAKIQHGTEPQVRIAPNHYLIYEKPKDGSAGKWKARWYDAQTGKKPKHTLGAADDGPLVADGIGTLTFYQAQAEAIKWFRHMETQARIAAEGGEVVDVDGFTVKDALEFLWERKKRPGARAKGLKEDKERADVWIIPTLGNIPLAKLTKRKIEDWLESMANSGRCITSKKGEPRKFAPSPKDPEAIRARRVSANRVLAILKKALNEAYREHDSLAEADQIKPCWQRVAQYAGVKSSRVRILSEEEGEERKILKACPPEFLDLVIAGLDTGARYEELTKLQVKHYDPKKDIPTIYISDSKTGKPRYVHLGSDRVIEVFNRRTASKKATDWIFTHIVKRLTRGDSQLLKAYIEKRQERASLPREERAKIVLEGFEDAWRDSDQKRFLDIINRTAGLSEPIDFYTFRHTYISMLKRKGCLLWYISEQTGTSEKMIEEHYGHIVPNEKAKAIQAAMARGDGLDDPGIQKHKPNKPKTG